MSLPLKRTALMVFPSNGLHLYCYDNSHNLGSSSSPMESVMKPIDVLIDDIVYEVVNSIHERFGVDYDVITPKLTKLIEDYIAEKNL